MYLKRLEVQGFKTFAQKTVFEFVPDRSGRRGVTAIVGPNGSGKSNSADALRWVMGEQSMKLLRGKKSEDVIFSGSDKRARSGFAEVTLMFDNDDKPELQMSEIVVTRRLYRDGQSEYEVNRQSARLQDVVLLLAQCGVGQRTYSVIGQGMVDHVLVASPSERKEFFDEAFGLKPFQLKRQSALNKIEDAETNLTQTEALLREIEPRLMNLERQAKRLEERGRIENELQTLERAFYGSEWRGLQKELAIVRVKLDEARAEESTHEAEAARLEHELQTMEKSVPIHAGFQELRAALDELSAMRASLRERELKLETKRAVAAVRAEKPWSPLPLSKIIEQVDALRVMQEKLHVLLEAEALDLVAVRALSTSLKSASIDLLGKLQRPAPEEPTVSGSDPLIEEEAMNIAQELAQVATQIVEAQQRLDAWNAEEQKSRAHIFSLQRLVHDAREHARAAERRASESAVELARLETRLSALLADVRLHAPTIEMALTTDQIDVSVTPAPDASARLQRLRSQLEWIGGIDPEVVKEYQETKERYAFLTTQVMDIRQSLDGWRIVVKELDTTIRERSQAAFKKLNHEFGVFFKKLFQGGEAGLVELEAEPEVDEEGNVIKEAEEGFAGIEIQATPPGKRFKSIALLSGGERALTSIALICAIMATNPSPFVVLDEVDAALDESNSRKFAEIVDSLADKTQFIVVTHNRATMTRANVLYGVTMGDDGVSQLVSVKLEDVEKLKEK